MNSTTSAAFPNDKLHVGIICNSFSGWLIAFNHVRFEIKWILVEQKEWIYTLKKLYPLCSIRLLQGTDWNKLLNVPIIGISGPLSFTFTAPFPIGTLYFTDFPLRQKSGWKNWKFHCLKLNHNNLGGVTDYAGKFMLCIHACSTNTFDVTNFTLPQFPRPGMDTIMNCTVSGCDLPQVPRLPALKEPAVYWLSRDTLHPGGLYPINSHHVNIVTTSVFSKSNWTKRKLSKEELFFVFDVPATMHKHCKKVQQFHTWLQQHAVPFKCHVALANELFVQCKVTVLPENKNGGGLSFLSPAPTLAPTQLPTLVPSEATDDVVVANNKTPANWLANTKHNRDEKATKADNAGIPVQFWNDSLAKLIGIQKFSIAHEKALNTIREFCLNKIWKASVTKCFCKYVRCRSCHRKGWRKLFGMDFKDSSLNQCVNCDSYSQLTRTHELVEKEEKLGDKVNEEESGSVYRWTPKGRQEYRKMYDMFRKVGRGRLEKEVLKDIEGFKDCIFRVINASVWKWDVGSRLFFWRWGEFAESARDGAKTFVQSRLPNCNHRQDRPKEDRTLELVRHKISDVRRKGYITKGTRKVKSVTSFFDVPKGGDDIRMVYNATSSGLNDAVWAPWFTLPTVETHLRAVNPGTFMGDCDLGEMFLNFMLDEDIRPYAGVDLTSIFPEEIAEGDEKLWEIWGRMLMGYKPSPYITTRDVKRKEPFLVGNIDDPKNVYRWSSIILNLPGSSNYTPDKPRVYRVREDGETFAADLFIYIDDVRNTAPSEEECWRGAHQVCCRLTWLGIQDAPRKKNFPTQTPRAWAGTIIHSDQGVVTVLVSEEKWDKTKSWVDWILEHVGDEIGMNHKELERCRGFLVYVSRTYTSFKPYLRGLHKTIDGWRPFRDAEGWKINWEIMAAKESGEWSHLLDLEPDEFVKPVGRLRKDFEYLKVLTSMEAPPKVVRRRKGVGTAFYGFGDASGKGFGFAVEIDGVTHSEFGQWNECFENEHSNFKELRNLVNAVESAYSNGKLEGCELYIFTDNFVAECSYYNGGSNVNKALDELVFRLWKLQMDGKFSLFMYHVAGTRMIQAGIDGLSRGDKSEGIARGMSVLEFVPIHKDPFYRSPSLRDWIYSLWNSEVLGELVELEPKQWFTKAMDTGNYLWNVAPGAAETAVEQLCSHIHGRPGNTHLFVVPRLCTSHWRNQLGKACDIVLTILPVHEFWNKNMHEPVMLGIYLPLLPFHSHFKPWRFKFTKHVDTLQRQVRGMQLTSNEVDWSDLRKFLLSAREVLSMPHDVARKMLQAED